MTQITSNRISKLGDVVTFTGGFSFKSSEWKATGVPVIKIANVRDGKVTLDGCSFVDEASAKESDAYKVQKDDLLMTLTGEIGAMGFYKENFEARLNQRLCKVSVKNSDELSLQYVHYFLTSPTVRQVMWQMSKGAAQANISVKDIAGMQIPMPPLQEQQRIVEALDDHLSRLDKALADLDHADSQTQVLRRSILNELLNPAPADLERGIGQMTSESALWEVRSLRDWGMDAQTGFASGVHNQTQDGVAHLRPMNVSRNGAIDLGEVKYVSAGAGKHRLESGDILFNNTNSDVLVGKTALFSNQGEYAFSNHMTRLRFPEDRVYSKFMASRLHFLWIEGYFKSICNNHVSQASVSTKALADIQVALPPLDEQRRVVLTQDASLSRLDFTRTSIASQKASIQTLRRSLLNKAFSGELGNR